MRHLLNGLAVVAALAGAESYLESEGGPRGRPSGAARPAAAQPPTETPDSPPDDGLGPWLRSADGGLELLA